MDSYQENFSYQVLEAQTGHKIPHVNGIHLHSIYDPIREAEQTIQKNIELLKKNSNILVFGLGFGHHINFIVDHLRKFHSNSFKVLVIEYSRRIMEDCERYNPMNDSNVEIFNANEVEKAYTSPRLIKFMELRPGVIYHQPSFSAFSSFYKQMISYTASRKIIDFVDEINDSELRRYLKSCTEFPDSTLEEYLEALKSKKSILNNKFEFLLLAYDHI